MCPTDTFLQRTHEHDDMVAVDLAHALADEGLLVLHTVALVKNQVPEKQT